MGQRLDLQTLLEALLGTRKVYFQPPANVQMEYPCIIYKRDTARTQFAGNTPYRYTKSYQVTYISQDPDDSVPDKIAALPMCQFDRHYAVKNLNHEVFSLFF
ncbi:MAG: hypothetical protein LC687_03865 [Actinobacteria bacterium]|nr:hypothetical protein [Actinomycetota bacterium]